MTMLTSMFSHCLTAFSLPLIARPHPQALTGSCTGSCQWGSLVEWAHGPFEVTRRLSRWSLSGGDAIVAGTPSVANLAAGRKASGRAGFRVCVIALRLRSC